MLYYSIAYILFHSRTYEDHANGPSFFLIIERLEEYENAIVLLQKWKENAKTVLTSSSLL